VLDEDNANNKKKITAKRQNAVAMANLSMTFMSKVSMELIYKSHDSRVAKSVSTFGNQGSIQEVSAQ
jgi:hypothetical protein